MQNVAILLEHVDLLNTSNRLHIELLESSLELPVVTLDRRRRLLDLLPAGRTLAAWWARKNSKGCRQ